MTGEMNYAAIGVGGEHEEWAAAIRAAALSIGRRTGWRLRFEEMRPFDVYQGPYAQCTLDGESCRLWSGETELDYVLEATGWGCPGQCTAGSIDVLVARIKETKPCKK